MSQSVKAISIKNAKQKKYGEKPHSGTLKSNCLKLVIKEKILETLREKSWNYTEE